MKKLLLPLASFAAILLLTGTLRAQVPQILNYQGRVAVGNNPPVNFHSPPNGLFKFALVNATGATAFWSNDGSLSLTPGALTPSSQPTAPVSLSVTKGLYSVLLGDTALSNMTAIPNSVFANSDVRLRVWFNDGTNGSQLLVPDQRIAAVGYAVMAAGLPNVTASGGKVGIGTTTPGAALSIYSTTNINGENTATFGASGIGGNQSHIHYGTNGDWYIRSALGSGKVILQDSGGNVGIGTAAPATALQVSGTVTATAFAGNGAGLTDIPASAVATPPPGMVLIPAGAFTMGNSVAADTDITNATPVSTTVSAFYMDVNEVTLSQWQSVYDWATLVGGYTFTHAGAGKGANHPVHTVDWYDCVKWCNARSEREGKTPVYYTNDAQTTVYRTGNVNVTNAQVKWSANGYRLPTEAEWEKAARGGLSGQRFPWGDTISQKLANYDGTATYSYNLGPNGYNAIGSIGGLPATSPVGTFAANAYGLYDMAGNVSEWCWDWSGTPYAGGGDPHGPTSGTYRVCRGGAWGNSASVPRCAVRLLNGPSDPSVVFGFRCVRGL